MELLSPTAAPPSALPMSVRPGEYFHTERDLYRVEEVHGEFAQIEDCRNEIVLEVAVTEILQAMEPVASAA